MKVGWLGKALIALAFNEIAAALSERRERKRREREAGRQGEDQR